MSVFQDTWKLDIDMGFAADLDKADDAVDNIDKSFKSAAKAAKEFDRASARAAKEVERELAKAEREAAKEARALAKAQREVERASRAVAAAATKEAKALARDAAKAARLHEKATREAARGAKALAKEMDRVSRSAKKEAAALKKSQAAARHLDSENAKKGLEGVAQSLGISAVSGERLANVWLAAGAAVGAGLALITNAVSTYISTNKKAKASAEHLATAWERMQVAAVKYHAGVDGVSASLDKNAARLAALTATMFPAEKATVKLTAAQKKNQSWTDKGIGSLMKSNLILRLNVELVGALVDEIDDLIGVQEKLVSGDLERNSKIYFENFKLKIRNADKEKKLMFEQFRAAAKEEDRRRKADAADAKRKKAERARAAKAAKAAREAELKDIIGFEKRIEAAKKFASVLDDIEAGLTKISAEEAGFATKGGFGQQRTGFAERAAGLTKKAPQEGLMGTLEGPGEAGLTAHEEQIKALDATYENFAKGGIMTAVDSMGMFVESMADGSLRQAEFGGLVLASVGGFLEQFGKAAAAAGLIGEWFQAGGLFSNPVAGIGLGLAAVALGKAMGGYGKAVAGRNAASTGGDRAASTARASSRRRDRNRNREDDRDESPIIIMLDAVKVGRGVRKRDAQAARRGEFVASTTIRGMA